MGNANSPGRDFSGAARHQKISKIITFVAQTDLATLDSETICRTFNTIKQSLILDARAAGHVKGKPGEQTYKTWKFPDETRALLKLMRAMDFTTACKTYLADGATALGQSFAKDNNLYVIERMWPHMGLHCRMEFARDVARAQADFFNKTFPGMDFTIPPLSAVTGLDACGEFSYEAKDTVGEIHLSDRYLLSRSPQQVAAVMWHEGVHAALHQLGAKGGEFTADAELKKSRTSHDTNPNFASRLYDNDPEERLCFKTQAIFARSWAKHSPLPG